jgi:hypothetical protein
VSGDTGLYQPNAPHGFTVSQQPVARPFYCTAWNQSDNPDLDFNEHDWFFFTLPEAVTISSTEVYVDIDWQWTASDG